MLLVLLLMLQRKHMLSLELVPLLILELQMAVNSFRLAVISFSLAILFLMGLRQLVHLLLQLVRLLLLLVLLQLLSQHSMGSGELVHQTLFQLQCTMLQSRTRTPRISLLNKLDSKPQTLKHK